jgi:hypothetical protein
MLAPHIRFNSWYANQQFRKHHDDPRQGFSFRELNHLAATLPLLFHEIQIRGVEPLGKGTEASVYPLFHDKWSEWVLRVEHDERGFNQTGLDAIKRSPLKEVSNLNTHLLFQLLHPKAEIEITKQKYRVQTPTILLAGYGKGGRAFSVRRKVQTFPGSEKKGWIAFRLQSIGFNVCTHDWSNISRNPHTNEVTILEWLPTGLDANWLNAILPRIAQLKSTEDQRMAHRLLSENLFIAKARNLTSFEDVLKKVNDMTGKYAAHLHPKFHRGLTQRVETSRQVLMSQFYAGLAK